MYLTQALKRSAQTHGREAATIFQGRTHTWQELQGRVAKLAGALQQLGLKTNDRVAILSLNSDRYLELYFAVPWAGGVVVPMNTRWAVAEHIYSLNDSGATILVVDDRFESLVPQLLAGANTVTNVLYAGDGPVPEGMVSYETALEEADPVEDALRGNEDLAGIYYTGGTTGFPKGVMLSHAALWSNAISNMHEMDFKSDSIYLHAPPMFHLADGAASNAVTICGGTHVMVPTFQPELVLNAMVEQHVSHSLLVPTMVKMFLEHPGFDQADLSSLKYIIYGASPMPEPVLKTALTKLPHCKFIQAYGQTELSPVATILPPEYHVLEGPRAGKLRSAGRASYCVEIKIVDPDGQEVPRGTVGEILVHGPNTMQGYWNNPQATALALVDGWVHTGDGGYMDEDGFIFVVDRLKDMIISGGENVYSAEVENSVASHPAVSACAVIGIPDERWGEAVHAVVVLKAGTEATAEEIISHCHTLIAGYKCPRSISFQESLPISAAGKIMKTTLKQPYWQNQTRKVN
ncbi:MAG: long-chain-fatty-acid--CoA ligase [Chloroflexi bacterium]|nr:long-chain-fatty-acid--CoA ligase [Chloroflexota bacterium]OJV92161.1 MAG: fatty-acid--CoA ligase [Chloroflexi bacterium 54-19]